ncbi:MAG: tyrosine-type recombinase/integrase [Planctomycetota bacterium]|nr:tyrosine-type recombinase/integrase [Planctomycetota bacterium]
MLREYERMHPTMLDYFKYREATYSGRGLHKYKHNLLTYWRWLQDRNLDPLKVKADDMAEYQRHIADRHRTPKGQRLSPSSQVKRLTAVRAYYRFLERSGVLLVDVSKGLRLPRIPKGVTKRDYLSLQEATALLQTQARRTEATRKTKLKWAIELRNLAFFSLAIATGRRRNGLFELKVDDLDFKRDEIRVSKEKGKTGRVLPVARWAMMVAREYIELARPRFLSARNSDYLFVSKRNGTLSHQVNSALTEVHRQTVEENPDLAELAGKRLTPHGLRVTFAKLLFNGGCNLRSVNELMLHDRLSTTAHYTPLKLEELRRTCRLAHPRA